MTVLCLMVKKNVSACGRDGSDDVKLVQLVILRLLVRAIEVVFLVKWMEMCRVVCVLITIIVGAT
ncbi:hypothetical protein QUC31_011359, partial [Theobroma cacao]